MKNFLCLIIIFISLSAHSQMTDCAEFTKSEDKQATSKLLKTYTYEYWQIANKNIADLPAPLLKKGFVIGDFHFNNLGIYFNYINNKTEMVVNDFDDAGQNYLIIDLFKYISFVQKTDKDVELDKLIHHYLDGLQMSKEVRVPSDIRDIMNSRQSDFNKSYAKYIKNRKEEFSKFNKDSLTADQKAKIQILSQLKMIKQLNNMSYMVKVNDSGSSKDLERYEFFGTDSNGADGVIEFKKLKCSATGARDRQDLIANFEYIKKFYLAHFSSSLISGQNTYKLANDSFLVRQKTNNPLKKLEIEKLPTDRLQEYVNFYAYYLGTIHAKSADIKYSDAVRDNEEEILKKAKHISKKFKEAVKE